MPPVIISSAPFDILMRSLELRVVEVQLAKAVSLVPASLRAVLDAQKLARVDDSQVFSAVARTAAEVLANSRALCPGLAHEVDRRADL